MSEHTRRRPRQFQLWMAANTAVLLLLSGWVVHSASGAPPTVAPSAGPPPSAVPGEGASGGRTRIPAKKDIMSAPGHRFGLSAPHVPWSQPEIDAIAAKAGARPTLLQYFVKWTEEFRPESVDAAYGNGGVPVISWEPWSGSEPGLDQPAYALRRIAAGEHDEYLTRFATAVRDHRWPIGLRFAHEMNGSWYPWSEQRSGNRPGEYVRAWRHVHDVFTRVGATNVIWIWSPNIIRPVPKVSLKALYPGDRYVDWIGLVGYSTGERTATALFGPTLRKLRAFTDRPLLITETGSRPEEYRLPFIRDLFGWLNRRTDVVGFIWFEYDRVDGGSGDWRFTTQPDAVEAFRTGLARLTLAPPPA
ncbi:glycosyl hydrolase [Micromonospora sp. NBRC 101691]|uniref:glycoside hydrolase family 26 protein n=1 Tax=Micromonospora sp. NBRC 101691 TaxID=3032198 RepID=UPI0025550B34|nr:glycosyl hydrolase [Micromonospora sp. NBRC 101691]